jgi:DNA repair exonuclease SbcCD ATPase subunit
MIINSINTQATQFGANQAIDSYSRNIKEQIAQKQKELQELSKSTEMSLEDKMKKRQEIQQEIADLNSQLRQHQIEKRKEQQQSKQDTMADTMANANEKEKQTSGMTSTSMQVMSQATMTGIISADNTMKQVKVQSQVKTNLEDRAGVLESEIKYDTSGNTEAKQNELADIKSKVNNIISSQASTLSDINNTIKEAEKEDRKTATANEDDKINSAQNSDLDTLDDDEDENTEIDNQTDVSDKNITEQVNQASNGYPHIDIKL